MKRFYRDVAVVDAEPGFVVALDGRPLRTPGGQAQIVPTRALADIMAAEWSCQGEKLDPARFAARDMADYALDMVAADRGAVVDKLLRYAETDTLCYRADPGSSLAIRQETIWEPILGAFEARGGLTFTRVAGIVHAAQPAATLDTLRARLNALPPFTLAALEALTTLAHSLVVGLSALDPDSDPEALWNAANLEEDWQAQQWGEDAEAAEVRARRKRDFLAARAFAAAARA